MKEATGYAIRKHGARHTVPYGTVEKGVIAVPEEYVEGHRRHPALFAADLTGFSREIKFLECRMVGITKAAALRLLDHVRRETPALRLTMTNGFGYHDGDGSWYVTALMLRHADGRPWSDEGTEMPHPSPSRPARWRRDTAAPERATRTHPADTSAG